MTRREELLSSRKRAWDETLENVQVVHIFPSRRKHDSGFNCMDFVASCDKGEQVRFGGGCDDLELRGVRFRIDCEGNHLRVWNPSGFSVSHDLSTITLRENQPHKDGTTIAGYTPIRSLEEVKYGKWESVLTSKTLSFYPNYGWKCSCCGAEIEDKSKKPKYPSHMKFCWNCGVKMQEDL